MATGIVEILKYTRTGIRDWHTKKDKKTKGQVVKWCYKSLRGGKDVSKYKW